MAGGDLRSAELREIKRQFIKTTEEICFQVSIELTIQEKN